MLPGTKTGIGIGYVKTEYAQAEKTIFVVIRNKNAEAKVIK
jgi:glycine cleavage system aminomethyltransferase T